MLASIFAHLVPKRIEESKKQNEFEKNFKFHGGDDESMPIAKIIQEALEWRDENKRLAYLTDSKYGLNDYYYLSRMYENIQGYFQSFGKNIDIKEIKAYDVSASGFADYMRKLSFRLTKLLNEKEEQKCQ